MRTNNIPAGLRGRAIKEINMIEIRYLQAESGANKFGTCNCCGKSSSEDPLMISVKFSYYGHGTTICLCDDCKKKLMEALLPANNSEIPNSSDTISRQAAIEALYHVDEYNGRSVEAIRKLPPAQPEQLEQCPIYGGMCAYPSDQCYDCPRHAGAKMGVTE